MTRLAPSPRPSRRARLAADATLLAVAVVWGATFPIGKAILQHVGPFTYLTARFVLATALLAPLAARPRELRPGAWRAAMPPGLALGAGYALQTVGLRTTDATIAAFITGLSVVLVPILSRAVGRPPAPTDWLGAGAGLAGLAMLTLQRIEWPSVGEALVFGCALCFAIHIVLLDRRARTVPPVVLTTGQMAVAAVACAAFVPFEVRPSSVPGEIGAAIAALAVFGSAGAFLAQSWAQKFTTPAHVGLLFTAEPVAAAALAHAWLGEVLTARQAWGAVLILGGIAVVVAAPGLRVARRVKMEE